MVVKIRVFAGDFFAFRDAIFVYSMRFVQSPVRAARTDDYACFV